MAPTNDFLPFCPTDTGTNLLSESDYTAAADRTSGNKPGIASAKLNNKALRQANAITSQLAQLTADVTGTDVLDDALAAKLLAQFHSTFDRYAPNITTILSGSSTFNLTYIFKIATGSATAAATYTHNAVTYTVVQTVASGTTLRASGPAVPLVSGTLTKATGTGDATITFYAVRAPISLDVIAIGGGGGGTGSGTSGAGTGGTGGNTTFGTTLIVANGGTGSPTGGLGGSASLGTGPVGLAYTGGSGTSGQTTGTAGINLNGGAGASGPFGGSSGGGAPGGSPIAGVANSGSGGGGGGYSGGGGAGNAGGGGGAGGLADGTILNPSSIGTFPVSIGAGGTAGGAGTSGAAGAAAGSGVVKLRENYQ